MVCEVASVGATVANLIRIEMVRPVNSLGT